MSVIFAFLFENCLLSTVGTLYIMFACSSDDEYCFADLVGENALAQAEVESQVV